MKKNDVYTIVTNKVIEALESGVVAWHKPWAIGGESAFVSHNNGKSYSFLNSMLIAMQGGSEGEYLTMKQASAEGGKIKQGAKAKMITYYQRYKVTKKVVNEEGEEVEQITEKPVLKYYNVFHISDCEGIEAKYARKENKKKHNPIKEAEKVIKAYDKREDSLKIICDVITNDAYYSPSRDMVCVPCLEQYENKNEYYSTFFHELVHSTGHQTRCDRKLTGMCAHGNKEYSAEELVAEMGSAMIMQRIGIQTDKVFANSASYIASWLKALKNDRKMIFVASARAEKAVKYIFNDK